MSATITVVLGCDRCPAGGTVAVPIDRIAGFFGSPETDLPDGWRERMGKHFCPECLAKRQFVVVDPEQVMQLNELWHAMKDNDPKDPDWMVNYHAPFWEHARREHGIPQEHPDYIRSWSYEPTGIFTDLELPA